MSRRETEFDRELVTETKKKLKRPPLYKVLLHNDDYTTKEFVVQVLQYVFHKEHTAAVQIMLHVHKKGIGVAGVYTYEIAETKVALVENLARQHEGTLKTALKEAQGRRHEYLCLEHLLYALLQDKDASRAIINCGGDIERLRKSLEEFFNGELETLPAGFDQEPQQTLSFHRVLQRAVIHAQSAERKEINGGNLLIAMFRESDSYAVYLLENQGITRFDVVNYVS